MYASLNCKHQLHLDDSQFCQLLSLSDSNPTGLILFLTSPAALGQWLTLLGQQLTTNHGAVVGNASRRDPMERAGGCQVLWRHRRRKRPSLLHAVALLRPDVEQQGPGTASEIQRRSVPNASTQSK